MYTDRLKLKLRGLGVTYAMASKTIGIKEDAFKKAMTNASFSYKNMVILSKTYDFSLDELSYDPGDNKVEETADNYTKSEYKHTLNYGNTIPYSIYKETKTNYEARITDFQLQVKDLQGQIQFLQHLIKCADEKPKGAKSA